MFQIAYEELMGLMAITTDIGIPEYDEGGFLIGVKTEDSFIYLQTVDEIERASSEAREFAKIYHRVEMAQAHNLDHIFPGFPERS